MAIRATPVVQVLQLHWKESGKSFLNQFIKSLQPLMLKATVSSLGCVQFSLFNFKGMGFLMAVYFQS